MSEDVPPADTSEKKFLANHDFGYALNGTEDVIDDTSETHRWIGTKGEMELKSYVTSVNTLCTFEAPNMSNAESENWVITVYEFSDGEFVQKTNWNFKDKVQAYSSSAVTGIKVQFNKTTMDVITESDISMFDGAYVEFSPVG